MSRPIADVERLLTEPDPSDMPTAAPSEIGPRRIPVQARSRERVDRILDAAAQLLAKKGYNAVKTNHIAKLAGVSIGSVYQFFPNRFAIFHALATRYQDRIADMLDDYMGPQAAPRPWEEVLDCVVDIYSEMWRREWSFFGVWIAIQNTAELRESDEFYVTTLIENNIMYFLRETIPGASEERLEAIARTIFASTNIILDNSMRGEEQDQILLNELKILLKSYVRHHIENADVNRS